MSASESPAAVGHLIAIGSPHGWDRLGWELVESITSRLPNTVCAHRLAQPVDLLNLPPVQAWWIVDACLVPDDTSSDRLIVLSWPDDQRVAATYDATSSHGWSLLETLHLAASLDRVPRHVTLVMLPVPEQLVGCPPPDFLPWMQQWEQQLLECVTL